MRSLPFPYPTGSNKQHVVHNQTTILPPFIQIQTIQHCTSYRKNSAKTRDKAKGASTHLGHGSAVAHTFVQELEEVEVTEDTHGIAGAVHVHLEEGVRVEPVGQGVELDADGATRRSSRHSPRFAHTLQRSSALSSSRR